MAQFPALPLWTDAYLADTTHLSTTEHGAYLLLLMVQWRSKDCKLPNDDRLLAKYAKMTPAQWKRVKPVLEPFFTVSSDSWVQSRLTDELVAVKQKSKSQSRKAKARHLKNKDSESALASSRQDGGICQSDAEPMPPITTPNSIPYGIDAVGTDPAKIVYDVGKQILGTYDLRTKAGGLITKWRKQVGDEYQMLAILTHAGEQRRSNIVEYITGCIRNRKGATSTAEQIRERRAAILEGLGFPESGGLGSGDGGSEGRDHDPPEGSGASVSSSPEASGAASLCGADGSVVQLRGEFQHQDGPETPGSDLRGGAGEVAGGLAGESRFTGDRGVEVEQQLAETSGHSERSQIGNDGTQDAAKHGQDGDTAQTTGATGTPAKPGADRRTHEGAQGKNEMPEIPSFLARSKVHA